jgi:large subunit ribosomal protein L21
MFAIIEDGGRQYEVTPGLEFPIDLREKGVTEVGQKITFDKVLLANGGGASIIGRPLIEGATITAEIVDPLVKGVKLEIGKMRRRKTYRRHTGHRQKYTEVKILDINIPGLHVVQKPEVVETTTEATA